eukprot:461732_1
MYDGNTAQYTLQMKPSNDNNENEPILEDCTMEYVLVLLTFIFIVYICSKSKLIAFYFMMVNVSVNGENPQYIVSNCTSHSFEDISKLGSTQLFLGDDDGAVVSLGFNFKFYGDYHTVIDVRSDGYLRFGGDLIFVLWNDLDPSSQGQIYYLTDGTAPNRRFIAQWTNIPEYSEENNENTFQAILFETSNDIAFRYQTIESVDYIIGIENQDRSKGLTLSPRITHSVRNGDCYVITYGEVSIYCDGHDDEKRICNDVKFYFRDWHDVNITFIANDMYGQGTNAIIYGVSTSSLSVSCMSNFFKTCNNLSIYLSENKYSNTLQCGGVGCMNIHLFFPNDFIDFSLFNSITFNGCQTCNKMIDCISQWNLYYNNGDKYDGNVSELLVNYTFSFINDTYAYQCEDGPVLFDTNNVLLQCVSPSSEDSQKFTIKLLRDNATYDCEIFGGIIDLFSCIDYRYTYGDCTVYCAVNCKNVKVNTHSEIYCGEKSICNDLKFHLGDGYDVNITFMANNRYGYATNSIIYGINTSSLSVSCLSDTAKTCNNLSIYLSENEYSNTLQCGGVGCMNINIFFPNDFIDFALFDSIIFNGCQSCNKMVDCINQWNLYYNNGDKYDG